ncbi:MAG TPA: VOC family protein [Dokdonella sp.]
MQLNAYLIFNGQAEAAFKFYAQCLRGQITQMLPFGEMAGCEHLPAEAREKIAHVRLEVGDQALMASDNHPDHPYEGIKGCSVSIAVTDPVEAARLFDALAEGGTVQMPLQETFWAIRFGMLVDRFGAAWMVNCAKPA